MNKRRKGWKRPEPNIKKGYMARYAAMVTGAAGGAVFHFPRNGKRPERGRTCLWTQRL